MLVIFTFYRNFLYPSTAVNLFSCYIILDEGSGMYGLVLFWLKVFTIPMLGALFHLSHAQRLYFFHNLGYSTPRLYTLTALFDLSIWLLLIILTAQFV
jgi:hypothetical protein